MNWQALISALLVLGSLGCSTGPDLQLIPNDRFLEPVYGQDGRRIAGRSSIADGYLREIEQRLEQCQKSAHSRNFKWELVPLAVSMPPELFKCTVRGTIYIEAGKLDKPNRTDGCVMIRHALIDNSLELRHSGRWVLIPFPMSGGHLEFAYRWGSPVATIAGREVPIAWGED